MGKTIAITSGKGGCGKSVMTAHTAAALSRAGRSVVSVDLDIGLRSLDVCFGLEDRVINNIFDIFENGFSPEDVMLAHPDFEGLFLLPCAQTRREDELCGEKLKGLTAELEKKFDFVLLDVPAGAGNALRCAMACAESAVVVTCTDKVTLRDASKIISLLKKDGILDIGVIINKYRPDLVRDGFLLSADEAVELLGANAVGIVPDDDRFLKFCGDLSAFLGTETGIEIENVAKRLSGEQVPLPAFKKKRFKNSYVLKYS